MTCPASHSQREVERAGAWVPPLLLTQPSASFHHHKAEHVFRRPGNPQAWRIEVLCLSCGVRTGILGAQNGQCGALCPPWGGLARHRAEVCVCMAHSVWLAASQAPK